MSTQNKFKGISTNKNFFYLVLISFIPFIFGYLDLSALRHDTLYNYHHFTLFYSYLKDFSSIILWNPYNGLGNSTSYINVHVMGPAQHLSIWIGKFLNLKNEKDLYLLSQQINFFIFISGIFLLLDELRINKLFIFPGLLFSSLLLNPYIQIEFNLAWVCHFPIGFWLLTKAAYLRKDSLNYLIVFCAFMIGYVTIGRIFYFIILSYYIYFFYFVILVLMIHKKNILINLKKTFIKNKLTLKSYTLLFFILLSGLYVIDLFIDILQNQAILSPNRKLNGFNSLDNFLNYPFAGTSISKYKQLFGSRPKSWDYDLFVGAIVFSLFLFFILNYRKIFRTKKLSIITSLLIILTILFFFTIPAETPTIPTIMYYLLPKMDLVRHLGYYNQLIKYFIIIFAIIGLSIIKSDRDFKSLFFITLFFVLLSFKKDFFSLIYIFPLFLVCFHKNIKYKYKLYIIFSLIFLDTAFHYLTKSDSLSTLTPTGHNILKIINESPFTLYNENTFKSNLKKTIIESSPFTFDNIREDESNESYDAFHYKLGYVGVEYESEQHFRKKFHCRETHRNDLVPNSAITLNSSNLNEEIFKKLTDCEKPIISVNKILDLKKINLDDKNKFKDLIKNKIENIKILNKDGTDYLVKYEKYDDQITSIKFDPNNYEINANVNEDDSLFIINENDYPGRNVYINNKKTKINRINTALISFMIPKGEHKINIRMDNNRQYFYLLMSVIYSLFLIYIIYFIFLNTSNRK